MARQTQKGLGSRSVQVLGVVGLISNQNRARLRQIVWQRRPTEQGDLQLQGRRLLPPMAMQARWGDDHHVAIRRPHHRASGNQGGQSFSEPHGIRQHGSTPGQQPTPRGALMREERASIRQGIRQSSDRNQLTVGRQRGQRLLQPAAPLGQRLLHRKPLAEVLTQHQSRFQGKLPTALP